MKKFKVTFEPEHKTVEVSPQTNVLQAAISAGIYLNSHCGGEGVCGRCKVILKKGRVKTQSTGRISPQEKEKGIHLACVTFIEGDAIFEIPPDSRLNLQKEALESLHLQFRDDYTETPVLAFEKFKKTYCASPLIKKLFLNLGAPTLQDRQSDWERIQQELRRRYNISASGCPLSELRRLGNLLRSSDWKITAVFDETGPKKDILYIEAGDTTTKNFGFAFDIGTTTISGQLIDLNNQKILASKSTYNKQAQFGSDVITRIMYAAKNGGLEALHQAVVLDLNEMIQKMALEQNLDLNDITCCVCAGNTTMMHLLLKIDPTHIRLEPYVPVANLFPVFKAYETDIRINPRGLLYCVPGVASYVGGDVTAGVIWTGMYESQDLSLLIDIGTNGEVVLGNSEFLISAAASAGPAFEGSGLSCGMRAAKGAINKVKINPNSWEVSFETIGGAEPLGICGSGYIDALAEMLNAGIIDKGGKFDPKADRRIRSTTEGKEFILVEKNNSASGKDIVITEADVDNLKRAKAAIFAAVSILLVKLGLDWKRIKQIFIAGGFGTSLEVNNAIRIGLLPDIEREKFCFIGNSSLAGCRSILCSLEAFHSACEVAKKISYLELSLEPQYTENYMAALFFPHTDLSLFPGIN